jgi:hypothetical protein
MMSAALPRGLLQHFRGKPRWSIIVVGEQAGDAGLHRLMEAALAERNWYRDLLIVYPAITPQAAAPVRVVFGAVVTTVEYSLLDERDLVGVLRAPDAADRAISVAYSAATGLLALLAGDGKRLVVPASAIVTDPEQGVPDLEAIMVGEGGKEITFGPRYSVPFDRIRRDHDPDYRAMLRREELADDQRFGARLRRARVAAGLGQGDIRGLTARSLRRIEAGVVEEAAIRKGTRKRIERALKLSFEQIKRS